MHTPLRRLLHSDWLVLRTMREVMVEDSPWAFDPAPSPYSAWPTARWQHWCTELAAGRTEAGWCVDTGSTPGRFDGLIVTGISGHPDGVSVGWGWLWVAPELRRRGVASTLVETVHDWGRALGADRAWMWVAETNTAAQALYRRLGYRPSGERSGSGIGGYREERWDFELGSSPRDALDPGSYSPVV